jgi:hypothetical protein
MSINKRDERAACCQLCKVDSDIVAAALSHSLHQPEAAAAFAFAISLISTLYSPPPADLRLTFIIIVAQFDFDSIATRPRGVHHLEALQHTFRESAAGAFSCNDSLAPRPPWPRVAFQVSSSCFDLRILSPSLCQWWALGHGIEARDHVGIYSRY